MNWCKLGFHKWEDVKIQRTKNACYGFAGAELPGMRMLQKCKNCPKERYFKLNLFMPDGDLHRKELWKNV